MVATVSPSVTVLSASSPLVIPRRVEDSQAISSTALTPFKQNRQTANIAYTFAPPGNLALLSRPAASVLLTQQAGEDPVILQERASSARDFAASGRSSPDFFSSSSADKKDSQPAIHDFGSAIGSFGKASQLSAAFDAPGIVNLNA